MGFIITTTGTPGTVIINDLGARTFVHPIISYDLEAEYSSFELSQSSDLQAAITSGEITVVDSSGNSITIVSQLMDLQSAYNSSINPEIITDATLGPVTIKRGSAADTDNVLVTKDGAGNNTFEVTGEGKVVGTDFNDVPLTTGGVATNYLDETGVYSAPLSGGVTSVTGTSPIASSGGATPAISISAATTGAAGSMSSADKTKLDGIAAGAQPGTVTGVTGTAPIVSSGGTTPGVSISAATISAAGSMSSADKTKLDGLSAGAQPIVSVTSTDTTSTYSQSAPLICSWDVERYKDTGFTHSTSTNNTRLTVDAAGTYQISGSIRVFEDSDQRSMTACRILINGVIQAQPYGSAYLRASGSSSDYWSCVINPPPLKLSANDYIEVKVQIESLLKDFLF